MITLIAIQVKRMNKLKKFATIIISAALVAAFGVTTAFAETYFEYDHFTFFKSGTNQITIIDYDDDSINMVVPSTILGDTVVAVNEKAFFNDAYIRTASLPDTLTKIGQFAFYSSINLNTVNIPANCTSLGMGAFEECISLTDVKFDAKITDINAQTFFLCSSMQKIVLPETVQSIGDLAFAKCTALNYVYIPKSTTSISDNAFYSSNNVKIYGYDNSYAQEYAKAKGITFVSLSPSYNLGDVNLDGLVNINDVTLLQMYLANKSTLSDTSITVADINKDTRVNVQDVTLIQKIVAHIA